VLESSVFLCSPTDLGAKKCTLPFRYGGRLHYGPLPGLRPWCAVGELDATASAEGMPVLGMTPQKATLGGAAGSLGAGVASGPRRLETLSFEKETFYVPALGEEEIFADEVYYRTQVVDASGVHDLVDPESLY
jgi:hypothetical protein